MKLQAVVEHLQQAGITVELHGDAAVEINQVASLGKARQGQISFLSDRKHLERLQTSQASAVILKPQYAELCPQNGVLVDNPYYAYAKVAQLLNPPPAFSVGVHPSAVVSASAELAEQVAVLPHATLGDRAVIGKASVIMSGAVIEADVRIGEHCRIGHNVVIGHGCEIGDHTTIESGTVIGGDGFGWALHQGRWEKIPQIGRVIIGCHVSIGNNCTVDRGAIEDTVIEDGCIIDNLVQVAHNVRLGKGCAVAAQVGFAGSTQLGAHCTVAGQAGFAGHIHIADQSHILAKAGVTHSLTRPGSYAGFPAVSAGEWQKNSVRARQLDKMAKQIKALERALRDIQATESRRTEAEKADNLDG